MEHILLFLFKYILERKLNIVLHAVAREQIWGLV